MATTNDDSIRDKCPCGADKPFTAQFCHEMCLQNAIKDCDSEATEPETAAAPSQIESRPPPAPAIEEVQKQEDGAAAAPPSRRGTLVRQNAIRADDMLRSVINAPATPGFLEPRPAFSVGVKMPSKHFFGPAKKSQYVDAEAERGSDEASVDGNEEDTRKWLHDCSGPDTCTNATCRVMREIAADEKAKNKKRRVAKVESVGGMLITSWSDDEYDYVCIGPSDESDTDLHTTTRSKKERLKRYAIPSDSDDDEESDKDDEDRKKPTEPCPFCKAKPANFASNSAGRCDDCL